MMWKAENNIRLKFPNRFTALENSDDGVYIGKLLEEY
jgi:hypothetical protein